MGDRLIPAHVHGTHAGYGLYRCRCLKCVEFSASYRDQFRYGVPAGYRKSQALAQGGVCPLCEGVMENVVIDQSKISQQVRGVICARCKTGLSKFQDDPILLKRAISYLNGGTPPRITPGQIDAPRLERKAKSRPSGKSKRQGKWDNPDGTRMQCCVGECEIPVHTQGMCKYHYNHFYYMSTSGQGRRRNEKYNLGDLESP